MSHEHHDTHEHEERHEIHLLEKIDERLRHIEVRLEYIEWELRPQPQLAQTITFQENNMNAAAAGQTQVFTGTLAPVGSVLAPDAVATISSNDPAVSPTLDSTQLIVSVTYPDGWVESTATPLAFAYATTSASTGQALSATITPSAPVVLASSIAFSQTT